MPIYTCRVADGAGRTSNTVREAASEEVLLRQLGKEGLSPIEVRSEQGVPGRGILRGRIRRAAVQEFAETMAMLLSSGLTLRDALEVAQSVFPEGKLNLIVIHLLEAIRKGSSVDQALAGLGDAFPAIVRGLVRVGEKTGSLEGTMRQVADYMAEEKRVRDKMTSSLTYPVLVLAVAIAGVAGIVLVVLPGVRTVFSELGAGLPERLEAVGRTFTAVAVAVATTIGAALLAALAAAILRRRDAGIAERIDRLALKVPVVGRIRSLRAMTNVLFALEGLTASGFTVE